MAQPIRFHFDPICPWCYQTSRWARRLAELGEVDVVWAVFSLDIVNAGSDDARVKGHARSERALRTTVTVDNAAGNSAVGRFYATLGRRVHERHEAVDDPGVVGAALVEAGLPAELQERAMRDDATWASVERQHGELVEHTRSFGVPTIVLDGGDGPAIFGPVISRVPADADAVELWRHVSWLTRYDNFSELKRDRTVPLDLPRRPRRR